MQRCHSKSTRAASIQRFVECGMSSKVDAYANELHRSAGASTGCINKRQIRQPIEHKISGLICVMAIGTCCPVAQ